MSILNGTNVATTLLDDSMLLETYQLGQGEKHIPSMAKLIDNDLKVLVFPVFTGEICVSPYVPHIRDECKTL